MVCGTARAERVVVDATCSNNRARYLTLAGGEQVETTN